MAEPEGRAVPEALRPPLGVEPKWAWHDRTVRERIKALRGAIARYLEAGRPTPVEWVEELNEHLKAQQETF